MLLLSAFLATKQDAYQRAVRLLAASEHAYAELGTSPGVNEKSLISSYLEAVQSQLDKDAFETAWSDGKKCAPTTRWRSHCRRRWTVQANVRRTPRAVSRPSDRRREQTWTTDLRNWWN